MPRSRLIRRLLASTLPAAMIAGLPSGVAVAEPVIGRVMNSYGLPGGVEMPTAEALPDGTLGATVTKSDYAQRNNIVFQAMPRVTTVLRYAKVEGITDHNDLGHIWDRSLDLRFQAVTEDPEGWRPAVAIGLQDFLGTGVYSGEYIVATKTLTPRLRASLGVGWGTLAGDPRTLDINDKGGKPRFEDWFRGSAKPFASVAWQATDRLTLVAEYSNDVYRAVHRNGNKTHEIQQGDDEPGNLNFGAYYNFGRGYQVGLYSIGGETIGAQFSFALNPREAPFPSGLEKAPAPVRPRPAPAADPAGWAGHWAADPTAQPAIQTALADALAKEGQLLESMALSANRAEVRIRNTRYVQQAEAIGRTARLMTRALPPSVETLVITSMANGMPASSVTLRRSDVERLENTEAGRIAAVSVLSDAPATVPGLVQTEDIYPRWRWRVGPYFQLGLFDPREPLGYDAGLEARGRYEVMPGLVLSGKIRQRAFGNIDQRGPGIPGQRGEHYTPDEYEADPSLEEVNGIPRVRSDSRMYLGTNSPRIDHLTLAWYAHPTENIYTRVTAGLLERAYGGVSAEALWKPANSPLGVGIEVNRVKKRDFDGLLTFRDYETTTGHVSLYYEVAQGYLAQLDVGRYLAGDKGATLTVTREFANGWRLGAFATKTDMSAEEFGEGSFDKGITLSIPVSWALGTPTRERSGSTIRSLSRDGGARVDVQDRLYDTIRDSQSGALYQGWGRFWR